MPETATAPSPQPSTAASPRRAPPRVVGLGHKLPDRVVPNGPIAERIGVDSDWIVRRTGIRERRYAAPGERTSDLADRGRRARAQDAGLKPSDIDLVLVATMTPDELTPNTAPLVAARARHRRAGAFDVGSACTGLLAALSPAPPRSRPAARKRARDRRRDPRRVTDPDDKRTAALFGDGAGAVVLSAEGEGAIGPVVLASDGGMGDTIVASA